MRKFLKYMNQSGREHPLFKKLSVNRLVTNNKKLIDARQIVLSRELGFAFSTEQTKFLFDDGNS